MGENQVVNTKSNLYLEMSRDEITRIFEKRMGVKAVGMIYPLPGGMFNTTYKVEYGTKGEKAVLRLGPVNRHLLMGFEEKLMEAENEVYRLCKQAGIPCSKVLCCDTSKQLADRDYMIVEYIDSIPMTNADLDETQKARIREQVGSYTAKLHGIQGESFGYLSRAAAGQAKNTWAQALQMEADDITDRLRKYNTYTEEEFNQITGIFRKYEGLLNEIKTPCLVHSDLWEGNVLLHKQGETYEVAAIIDADRAVFGDIDFEFASQWMTDEFFFKGYQLDKNDYDRKERKLRRIIYRIIYLLIESYVGVAEYNDIPMYENSKKELLKIIAELI